LPSISYPSDLTEREWALLEPLLPRPNQEDCLAASTCG
jgi:hypothetical protein